MWFNGPLPPANLFVITWKPLFYKFWINCIWNHINQAAKNISGPVAEWRRCCQNYLIELLHDIVQSPLIILPPAPLPTYLSPTFAGWKTFILLYKIALVAMFSFKLNMLFRREVAAMRYQSFQLSYQVWHLLGCSHVFIRRFKKLSELIFKLTLICIPLVFICKGVKRENFSG